jgi:hypothetical protein
MIYEYSEGKLGHRTRIWFGNFVPIDFHATGSYTVFSLVRHETFVVPMKGRSRWTEDDKCKQLIIILTPRVSKASQNKDCSDDN